MVRSTMKDFAIFRCVLAGGVENLLDCPSCPVTESKHQFALFVYEIGKSVVTNTSGFGLRLYRTESVHKRTVVYGGRSWLRQYKIATRFSLSGASQTPMRARGRFILLSAR